MIHADQLKVLVEYYIRKNAKILDKIEVLLYTYTIQIGEIPVITVT